MTINLPKLNSKALFVFVVFVVLFAVAVFFGYEYFQNRSRINNPKTENEQIIATVGKLVLLPADEVPTVATVSDVTKLRSQPFFVNAENGDKVLIYQNSRKAILYRPGSGKIVEIGPVSDGAGVVTEEDQPETEESSFKVAIMNGTATAGLAAKMEKTIKDKNLNIEIVTLGNAAGRNYKDTVVIAMNETRVENAKTLADSLNAEIGELPGTENFEDLGTDVVVIVGSDAI